MPEITIGRLRGGYSVSWSDPTTGRRRRYQLSAHTREEAEAEARERFIKETWTAGSQTISDIWDAYVQHLGDRPTAATMTHTGKAVLPHFGALWPSQIKTQDCRDYTAARLRAGKRLGTAWTELGHLRSALKWAVKTNLIDRSPYIELPPKPDSNVRPLDGSELQKLIDHCEAPHIRLAVILLIGTAARRGAILDLTWDRVDMARGMIDLRLPDGVTRKGRAVVPMNRMVRAALEVAYQARLTDYVIEWAGKPVKSISTGYRGALRRAGMKGVNIHQIRHSVAVRMLEAGMPIAKVSQFLGHSSIHITEKTYARFMPEHLADAAEILDLSRFGEPHKTSQGGSG
ncbi:MAG: site-specific integrase [Pseudomonadota bacterium]